MPQALSLKPIILLVRPQLGENIGAVARAMMNFGLAELRLVAPRDGWPNSRAYEVSSGAHKVLDEAKIFPDFTGAIADLHHVYAATARPRDMEKRVVTPEEAMGEIVDSMIRGFDDSKNISDESSSKIALAFGPERTGLENEEIALSDTIITIPTAPVYSSLNLAQSVVVLSYEWFKRSVECGVSSVKSGNTSHSTLNTPHSMPAPKADWQGLFSQLENYLDQTNYYRVAHKKPIMWQNLQTMLMRGQWSEQELRSFRGMLRAIWEREKKNR
jgi:tRNA/rRNA methyltransferase